jgi:predicted ATP-dependent endonuclease of OLD family
MSDFKPYLHSAHIEGYKSIVKCDVTFKPGLNIIIGKNGTGKTNLLEGIRLSTVTSHEELRREPRFHSILTVKDCKNSRTEYKTEIQQAKAPISNETDYRFVDLGDVDKRIKRWKLEGNIKTSLEWQNQEVYNQPFLFSHSIPKNIPFFNDMETIWKIQSDGVTIHGNQYNPLDGAIYSLQAEILSRLYRGLDRLKLEGDEKKELVETVILKTMKEFIFRILSSVKICTPITNIKVNEGRITNGNIDGELDVRGYDFLFEINGRLHPFDNLSDGTKRVLLLAIEIAETQFYTLRTLYNLRIYLLEEPELGIHPHQLHLLMNFIKEQSEEKQIIITTHSPQVMDILNQDELDRIIIADFDPEKGSTFRHLNEKELRKAKFIMKDEPLSYYWRYSDLEHTPMF